MSSRPNKNDIKKFICFIAGQQVLLLKSAEALIQGFGQISTYIVIMFGIHLIIKWHFPFKKIVLDL
uniref:Uncharacterized protein n=1 Tax=Paenibacillus athensensis TaxID=1967502 RepID=A0A4Y8QAA9_9BACL